MRTWWWAVILLACDDGQLRSAGTEGALGDAGFDGSASADARPADGRVLGDAGPPADATAAPDGAQPPTDAAAPPDAEPPPSDSGSPPVDAAAEGCPPGAEARDGRCLPSCGAAGGNTCVGPESTLCDCLPTLETFDCAVCCARPAHPAPAPASHHIVVIADRTHWDSILALSDAGLGPMITSQNKPDDLPFERWARNIHHGAFATGEALADAVHRILCVPGAAPARVMIDEVRGESVDKVAVAAERLRTRYPQWAGRWGAYLVNGEAVAYPRLNPAIDALLDAQAIIGVELYAHQSRYCAAGGDAGARDAWLATFFRGDADQGRFHWLAERRAARGSASQLTLLFGVTDAYLDGRNPAIFLDRMFYVWATRSGYPATILPANGGVGAYKWEAADVSNTSRDLAFHEAYQHYGVQGLRTSRLGQVPCD